MKVLHTADWHLGKVVNGISMLDEQRYILRQIIEIAKEEEIDAIIIAGDLYDRSVPPTEAVKVLNDTLYELNVMRKIPIFAISGNHDSAERLSFGSAWYEQNKLYLAGRLTPQITPIEWANTQFWLVPYHDAITAKAVLGHEEIRSFDDAMKVIIEEIKIKQNPEMTQIFIGHAFIAGGTPTDSERQLSVGNVDRVAITNFDDFDYVALGHLHNPHALNNEKIVYSGSPLKYSFSEANEIKSVRIVEFTEGKLADVQERLLKPLHDMRVITGYLAELLASEEPGKDDFLQVNLLDEGALIDPIGKLREVYPNVLHLERKKRQLSSDRSEKFEDVVKKDDLELFSQFFDYVSGKPLNNTQKDIMVDLLETVKRGEE